MLYFFLKKKIKKIKKRRKRSVSEQKLPADSFREFTGRWGKAWGGVMDRKEKKPFPATGTEAFFFLHSGSLHHRGNAQSLALPRRYHRHKNTQKTYWSTVLIREDAACEWEFRREIRKRLFDRSHLHNVSRRLLPFTFFFFIFFFT